MPQFAGASLCTSHVYPGPLVKEDPMPLLFCQLCYMLSALENFTNHDPPLLPQKLIQKYGETIRTWFGAHKVYISGSDSDPVALLSTLFPSKRPDRVYSIQARNLTSILKRCLGLGMNRKGMLDEWRTPNRGDLSDCVKRVLQQAEFPEPAAKNRVTVEEIDTALAYIAKKNRFSGPRVRERDVENSDVLLSSLEDIYKRLQSREAQWLTRLILKDFSCIDLEKHRNLVYSCIDPQLPAAMRVYDSFEDAVTEAKKLAASPQSEGPQAAKKGMCVDNAHTLIPKIGVKVPSPRWMKAKGGVKHAVSIINGRTMSIERKYDGEYAQIHIDLSKGENCIQIFSKSGKDSTADRKCVHEAIKQGLRLENNKCFFSHKCILEGELLIWSDETNDVSGFHKIRKYVDRSGSFLGTEKDSQPHSVEHPMIMFYDVLLVDDDAVLHQPYTERRRRLRRLVTPIRGKAGIVSQEDISFSNPKGPKMLKKALAKAFVRRWEGLVLKPSNEPYSALGNHRQGTYTSCWIKLKKDCINGLGDTGDFAVVGAAYDATRAAKLKMPGIRWTHFFIGCLRNKMTVLDSNAKPDFLVVDCVVDCINKDDLRTLNQHGQFSSMDMKDPDAATIFDLEIVSMDTRIPKMQVIFKRPFVFEIAGSGFERGPNRDMLTLRFPRALKIHLDRSWKDAVDFEELQRMANEAMEVPNGDLQEEIVEWMKKLDRIDRGANRQSNAWDYTDDEYEDEQGTNHAVNADHISTSTATRRAVKSLAPPLVRMDTGEMKSNERRLSSGEICERPMSRHSAITENPLPTPPSSSMSSREGDTASVSSQKRKFQAESPPESRKRSSAEATLLQDISNAKTAAPRSLQQTQTTQEPAIFFLSPAHKRALREIRNSVRPSPSSSTTPVHHPRQSSGLDHSIVRKLPAAAVDLTKHSRHKRRELFIPSSPAKQTTAEECTTAATTQETLALEFAAKQPTVPNNDEMAATVPSTTPAIPDPPPTIQLHNFQDRPVLMHRSANCDDPAIAALIAYHNITVIELNDTPSLQTTDPFSDHLPTILLINPNNHHATTQTMTSLIAHLIRLEKPHSVEMWDRAALELYKTHDVGSDAQEVLYAFYARISWHPPLDAQSAEVLVLWRDGERSVLGDRELRFLLGLSGEEAVVKENWGGEGKGRGLESGGGGGGGVREGRVGGFDYDIENSGGAGSRVSDA